MYFIRTEETEQQAYESLQRGRSVRRWAFFGCTAWEHLAFAIPYEEQVEALERMGYAVDEIDITSVIQDELFNAGREDEIAEACNLTKLENGYYAEFLDGLCALESFDEVPSPEDCTSTLNGELFAKLVCYEGELVGYDPDEDWQLFRPTRIVWTHDTGHAGKRVKHI